MRLTTSFAPCTSGSCTGTTRGTDWVDMTSNNCNIQYTSEGTGVLNFNVCTNTQGPAFAQGLPGPYAYAHRALSDGSVLVADSSAAVHVSSSGTIINSCDSSAASGELFSMDVLPDQQSFAIANLGGDNSVNYITVAHCDAGQSTSDFSFIGVQPGQSYSAIGGVAIYGEFTQAVTTSTTGVGVPEFPVSSILVVAVGLLALTLMTRKMRLPTQLSKKV